MSKEVIKIWHNPSCSKSREAYNILEMTSASMLEFDYIHKFISGQDIKEIMKKLNITDIKDMLRQTEDLYKELDIPNKSQEEILALVLKHHQLIQRPIIIKGDKAVIARPMKNLIKLLEN